MSRVSYDTLKQPLSEKRTATFMQSKRETTEPGNLSVMAVIVLKTLMGFLFSMAAHLQRTISFVHTTVLHATCGSCGLYAVVMEKQVEQF